MVFELHFVQCIFVLLEFIIIIIIDIKTRGIKIKKYIRPQWKQTLFIKHNKHNITKYVIILKHQTHLFSLKESLFL